jgi:sugar phosphate isomerase/epimerase
MKKYLSFLLLIISINTVKANVLKVGYSIGITGVTGTKMKEAKEAGIEAVEVTFSSLIDKEKLIFLKTDEEVEGICRKAKDAAIENGIEIWSVHMPFAKDIDLSIADETKRLAVIALHQKVLRFCKIINPKIILFHPSYYLGLNERDLRKSQMIKSAVELNKSVKEIGAIMVIENMTGLELVMADGKRERPLMRSVEETIDLFDKLPKDIYSAIDLNHIVSPEKIILAMGKRLKTIHVADGDGKSEQHFFPCDNKGGNNWEAIMKALKNVKYTGAFIYECKAPKLQDYTDCYLKLSEYLK